jgi:hypothetical protein
MAPGSSATFESNKAQCPFCGSWENIPDGSFKATVEGFINILEKFPNPLDTAKDLLSALESIKAPSDLDKIKINPKFSPFSGWLPNTPEKIAAYVAIIYSIIQLLTQKPAVQIEYNNYFIEQYNKTVNISIEK